MRTVRTLVACLSLVLCVAASAAIRTATLRVESMTTDAAAQKLTSALKASPGVLDAAADPSSHLVLVRYDSAKTNVLDIGDVAAEAGFPTSVVASGTTTTHGAQAATARSTEALKDFDAVLTQTREARKEGRYGLVRNLALAMKVRADAVMSAQKAMGTAARQKTSVGASTYDLTVALSRAVATFGSAAEARDRAKVDQTLPNVRQAFQKLAQASDFDAQVAPAETAGQQQKSLTDQLMEKIKDLTK